jgi:hypothetical protein
MFVEAKMLTKALINITESLVTMHMFFSLAN